MTTTAPEGPSYKGLRPDLPMDGRVVEEGRRSCATHAMVVHADLHPLIHLSEDAAPPGLAVRYLVKAASEGCALL